MKYALTLVLATAIASCGNNQGNNNSTSNADSVNVNTDTIPTGNSSSSSEFNKGNSSPTGSTGGLDSTSETKSPIDKTATDLEKKNIEQSKKDSIK